ncbi:MAG: DUF2905 family protein [Anaerolineae bacterium]|nr:DUF2905 family protein [Anaerolineae bacterium]
MSPVEGLGRLLLVFGLLIGLLGIVLILVGKGVLPDRLPGDIHLEGRGWSCWVPLGLSVVLSLLLTLVLNLVVRLINR